MANGTARFTRLDATRREQVPQALARLVVVNLFIGLWFILWLARIPMPFPFLLVLVAETAFFLAYLRTVYWLPNVRSVEMAQYCMLAAEIVFHTTIVYFLGGASWLGGFAYVFGLIFTNTFLDLRRGFFYTTGAVGGFCALLLLEATGVIPHYVFMDQGALRYQDPRFVATTLIGGLGVFYSIYFWVNWVGHQLRLERDHAVRMQEELLLARGELQRANEELEGRVGSRTEELEVANAALRQSEEQRLTVIGNAPVVLLALNCDGVFTLLEGKGLEGLGIDRASVIGRSVFDVFRDQPRVMESVRQALAGTAATTVVQTGGISFETQLMPVRDGEHEVVGVTGVATNITERRRAESLLAEQRRVLEMIAVSAPLEDTLDTLVRMIEEQAPGMLCSVCLVGADAGRLWPVAGPNLPEPFRQAFARGIPIGPKSVSCGTAAYRRQPVFVEDIARDPLWEDYAKVALDNGIRASWATPIFSTAGDVLGTFAMYHSEPSTPGPDERHLINVATHVAGIAIERKRSEDALRESEERLRTVVSNAQVVLFAIDSDGVFTLSDGRGLQALGLEPGQAVGQSVFDLYKDVPAILHNIRRALAGEDFTATVEVGDLVFDTHYTPIRDGAGVVTGVTGVATNVTEAQRVEDALRESEERFRRLAENAADIIFRLRLSPTKSVEYMSPAIEAILGYTPEEFYADPETVSRIVHPDDRETIGQIVKDGRAEPALLRWLHKDGSIVWLETRTVSIRDADGTVIAVEGIGRDMTDRKNVEEALRESEARFRRLADNAIDVIFRYRFTPQPGYDYMSPGAAIVCGYTPEEFYADPALGMKMVHEEDRGMLEQLARRGERDPVVMRWIRKDGVTIWAETVIVPIHDENGRLVAMEGIARDVTARKQAELALLESEAKFRTMAETVAAAVFIFQGTKMQYVNSAAQEMTGYSREELLAMDFWEVIHPDARDEVKERGMARQRGEAVPSGYEVKLLTKAGQEKWVDFTAGIVDFEGRPAVLGTAFDITERKYAERALQETASRDPLTGLLNRRAGLAAVEERLEAARAARDALSVLILDLDRFKRINDTFSHETGDAALRQFASVLQELVGGKGVICRLGGDEFEIVLDSTSQEAAVAFARQVRQALLRSLRSSNREDAPQFTVSVGIACYPDDGASTVSLGRRADQAMYAAKAAGGDKCRTWRQITGTRAA